MSRNPQLPRPAAAEEITRHLSQLIRLDTTNPPGNEEMVARYLARQLERHGIENQVMTSAPGRANLVARVRGTGDQPPVMLLAHSDVVGANPDGWRYPPFSGALVDGEVWGRGALDMKGHIASGLVLLETLARQERPLGGDVILVVTADEEAGSRLGAQWLFENHRNLLEAQVVFNEGGGQRFTTPTGPVYTVQVAEKGIARIQITARGTGGHASIPRDDNAVLQLAAALCTLVGWQPETVITDAGAQLLAGVARCHPGMVASLVQKLLDEPSRDKVLALDVEPILRQYLLAGLHNTAVPTMLSASPRLNVAPDTATATVDARLLPGQDPQAWADTLQSVVGHRADVELLGGRPGVQSNVGETVFAVIDSVLDSMDPGARTLPYVSSAASDARALPGLPVLGFFPSRSDVDMMRMIHGVDERARVSDLLFAHTCLLNVTKELLEQLT